MATLVKIDVQERDAISRTLYEMNVQHYFFTIEANDNLLLCAIENADPASLWHLGKACGHAVSQDIKDQYL